MKHLAPVLATLLLASACGGTSRATLTQPPTAQPTGQPTVSPCPKAAKAQFAWPAEFPKDLPQPPTATLSNVSRTADGLTIVRFSTQTSLQDGVLFVVREVQKAGFTLGRGDAEPAEADAPFGRGDLRGVYKILSRTQCVSDWLVAVTHTHPSGTSPLLPTPSHGPSSSPLPFG